MEYKLDAKDYDGVIIDVLEQLRGQLCWIRQLRKQWYEYFEGSWVKTLKSNAINKIIKLYRQYKKNYPDYGETKTDTENIENALEANETCQEVMQIVRNEWITKYTKINTTGESFPYIDEYGILHVEAHEIGSCRIGFKCPMCYTSYNQFGTPKRKTPHLIHYHGMNLQDTDNVIREPYCVYPEGFEDALKTKYVIHVTSNTKQIR
jgi:hypothetical protein